MVMFWKVKFKPFLKWLNHTTDIFTMRQTHRFIIILIVNNNKLNLDFTKKKGFRLKIKLDKSRVLYFLPVNIQLNKKKNSMCTHKTKEPKNFQAFSPLIGKNSKYETGCSSTSSSIKVCYKLDSICFHFLA